MVSVSVVYGGDVPDRGAYQMELGNYIYSAIARQHEKRRVLRGDLHDLAQTFYLRSIDHHWKVHLTQMPSRGSICGVTVRRTCGTVPPRRLYAVYGDARSRQPG